MPDKRKTIAIIPAAGTPKNPIFPGVYDSMIPLNGKPTIDYILQSLIAKDIKEAIVLLDKNDNRTIEYLNFKNFGINIRIILIEGSFSLLKTLSFAIKELPKEGVNVLVNLGDTIFFGDHLLDNYLITSKEDLHSSKKWCYVENKGKDQYFYDKPESYVGGKVIVGIYHFTDTETLKRLVLDMTEKSPLSKVLEEYSKAKKFSLIDEGSKWLDTGNLNHYQSSKIFFLRTRHFNSFEYDPFKGIITKKSKNNSKILWEINWYNNIPKEMQIFSPRLVNYTLSDNNSMYSMEFYGYPSLTELYIYAKFSIDHWKVIINRILEYFFFIKDNYTQTLDIKDMESMYVDKTLSRIDEIDFIKSIKDKKAYIINGKRYNNPFKSLTKQNLEKIAAILSKDQQFTVIHGDLCFNNILFDVNTGIFKIIDPRGNFGKTGIYGDPKYDLAKLRHSINGMYDYITTDLFNIKDETINENEYIIDYDFFNSSMHDELKRWFDSRISKHFNINHIKLIEGLLFLTMIPLHKDYPDRQKLMLAKGIMLCSDNLSNIIDEK